jgi:hypothetical protein
MHEPKKRQFNVTTICACRTYRPMESLGRFAVRLTRAQCVKSENRHRLGNNIRNTCATFARIYLITNRTLPLI